MRTGIVILCVLGLFTTTCALAGSLHRRFAIDAEYRGLIRKSFPAIGSAALAIDGTPRAFRISGRGAVTHPCDTSRTYELSLDMRFRLDGGRVTHVATKNACAAGSADLLAQMERVLPFVHLARELPRPDTGRRAITTPHGDFEMVYAGTASAIEVTVLQRRATVAKFFLAGSAAGTELRSFRIPGKDSVQLSFVAGAAATTD